MERAQLLIIRHNCYNISPIGKLKDEHKICIKTVKMCKTNIII